MAVRCLQGSDKAVGRLLDGQGSCIRRELDQTGGYRIRIGLRKTGTPYVVCHC